MYVCGRKLRAALCNKLELSEKRRGRRKTYDVAARKFTAGSMGTSAKSERCTVKRCSSGTRSADSDGFIRWHSISHTMNSNQITFPPSGPNKKRPCLPQETKAHTSAVPLSLPRAGAAPPDRLTASPVPAYGSLVRPDRSEGIQTRRCPPPCTKPAALWAANAALPVLICACFHICLTFYLFLFPVSSLCGHFSFDGGQKYAILPMGRAAFRNLYEEMGEPT